MKYIYLTFFVSVFAMANEISRMESIVEDIEKLRSNYTKCMKELVLKTDVDNSANSELKKMQKLMEEYKVLLEEEKVKNTLLLSQKNEKLTLDEKSNKQPTMGFNNQTVENTNNEITLEDLYKEDIPKELLGRMSTIVNLRKLSENDYFNILTNSKGSPLKEFINKVEFHGDRVEISDATLLKVSMIVAKSELGVRAIKQTLNSMFSNALFDTADGEYKTHVITYKEIFN